MPPPLLYVMSTRADGPRGDRRPAGVLHAVPSTYPPVNTTLCGESHGLFWFGGLAFDAAEGERCPACLAARDDGSSL